MPDLGIKVIFQGNNLLRLLQGLGVSLGISLISVAISIVAGTVLGVVMTRKHILARLLSRIYLEFVRIMPQLVLLFIVFFGITKAFHIRISAVVSAIIVFSLWGTAEMGDLIRGALISIPRHQYESSEALGLTPFHIYRYVIIPQTLRRLIPPAVNLTTRMIKTTSLVVLIGIVEVLKTGQQIIEANRYTVPTAALWIYGVVFFLYFIVCYPISRLAGSLERRWKN